MELVRPSVLSDRLLLSTSFGLERDWQFSDGRRHAEAVLAALMNWWTRVENDRVSD